MRSKLFFFLLVLGICGVLAPASKAAEPGDDFGRQRHLMVETQIRGRGVRNPAVLRAMAAVPRHQFVPRAMRPLAYQDGALPIGHDQTISQPYIVALMSELLDPRPGQRVLEVGTGSGYQAAVLEEMGAVVFSIEIVPALGQTAQKVLADLGYSQIQIRIGDGYLGWPEHAPYDGIIVTCAPTRIPQPLQDQLAEGGRMVIPVGQSDAQQLFLLTKRQGRIEQEKIIDVAFVPMVDEKGKSH
jgi:protein-L-isoaspartate(D-aspartate) O-methyltransferase